MAQLKIILKPDIVRKEINMIINDQNKNTILKGMVKRGLNQDPNELREKLQMQNFQEEKPKKTPIKIDDTQKNVRDTFNKLRHLK